MKKVLLIATMLLSTHLFPCEQQDNIRKAFRIVECILRQANREVVSTAEVEHALEVYNKELRGACEDCKLLASFEYGESVEKLERLLEACNR